MSLLNTQSIHYLPTEITRRDHQVNLHLANATGPLPWPIRVPEPHAPHLPLAISDVRVVMLVAVPT
eukprot:3861821-Rhodomonas_salina.1